VRLSIDCKLLYEVITSTRNPIIQHIRNLQGRTRARRKANAFVIEGIRLVEEALAVGTVPELILYTEDIGERGQEALDRTISLGAKGHLVPPHVLKVASDTRTPQGLLAILPLHPLPIPEQPDFLIVLDKVRDPGNLGTVLRTAAAASVDALFLSPGTADPYAPKVVRAAMGAHFRLPIRSMDWSEIRAEVLNTQVFLADPKSGIAYTEADFKFPLTLIIGGEAEGANTRAFDLANTGVSIPMPGKTESLNVAAAAAILMFEVVRQRR